MPYIFDRNCPRMNIFLCVLAIILVIKLHSWVDMSPDFYGKLRHDSPCLVPSSMECWMARLRESERKPTSKQNKHKL
jgi:hypothetical protein